MTQKLVTQGFDHVEWVVTDGGQIGTCIMQKPLTLSELRDGFARAKKALGDAKSLEYADVIVTIWGKETK